MPIDMQGEKDRVFAQRAKPANSSLKSETLVKASRSATLAVATRSGLPACERAWNPSADGSNGSRRSAPELASPRTSECPGRNADRAPQPSTEQALSADMINIAVIDDHPLYRDGIVSTLKRTNRFEIVAEGVSNGEAVEIAQTHLPVPP
jgi:hypothetical protein